MADRIVGMRSVFATGAVGGLAAKEGGEGVRVRASGPR